MKYYQCPYCGDNLDHGERCDCKDKDEINDSRGRGERVVRISLYERTRAAVYATGNKWAIENFHATHG